MLTVFINEDDHCSVLATYPNVDFSHLDSIIYNGEKYWITERCFVIQSGTYAISVSKEKYMEEI